MRRSLLPSFFLSLALPSLAAAAAPSRDIPAGAHATLAVLETTDIHANIASYDYYKLAADPSLGLERTATLIGQARRDYPDNLLFDDGDAIQGTALADYQALVRPPSCGEALGVYKAMNALRYDGGTMGNHEFNYGLGYLNQVTGSHFEVDGVDPSAPRCAGPAFPMVLANVYSKKSHAPLFEPYRIIDKHVTATGPDGQPLSAVVRVGIIGFAPPGILAWDKRWLDGKVYTEGARETAQKYLPEMRAKGADLVVLLVHGGLDGSAYSPAMENPGYYLSQLPGVDALLLGHAHQLFPNAASRVVQFDLPGVDKARGFVNGVPTVMANLWGKHLGLIGLHLAFDGRRWVVEKDRTTVEARAIALPDQRYVEADAGVKALIAAEHAATIAYVKTPLGTTDFRMASYFADVGDVSAIEAVNQAQADYVARYVRTNLPQYAGLPVLSMASPFKSGAAGAGDYTDVKAGPVALNNAADLYLYPNALAAVKTDGAQLKAWLEFSARRFNTIDPAATAPQELVNPAHPSFNFDEITSGEVRYEIDLAQPPGRRIRALSYRGAPVGDSQELIVATNSYRAGGGGNVPGLDGSRTVLAAPDANRDVLIAHIQALKQLTRAANGAARSWTFSKMKTAGPVVFHAPPGLIGLARAAGLDNVSLLREDDGTGKGFALYAVDLAGE